MSKSQQLNTLMMMIHELHMVSIALVKECNPLLKGKVGP
jgi:hypothetical protein